MDRPLLERAAGFPSNHNVRHLESLRFLQCLHTATGIIFDGRNSSNDEIEAFSRSNNAAHPAGVNCIAIDKFDGRLLISGGSDSSISIWDLEEVNTLQKRHILQPKDSVEKSTAHKFGITDISFYPFDAQAFLSSSYDHKLKIYATQSLVASASFDLGSVIYSHSLSPIADHLLVACATQHPAVRLVDLRSGATTHSLAGHAGSVLSVAWSPKDEYILASGGSDGAARLWDIRRSAGSLGVLDMDDSIGCLGDDGFGKNARPREHGKAHTGPCNGVVWTDDASILVTCGHDERVRCWDIGTGANALSHFGPIIKNSHLSTLLPLVIPSAVLQSGPRVMVYPNGEEILMFDLLEGTLLRRMRAVSVEEPNVDKASSRRNATCRVTSLAWRGGDIEMYSAHTDGTIRAWLPKTQEDMDVDAEEASETHHDEDEGRKRKREVLDQVFRDLTKQKITFT